METTRVAEQFDPKLLEISTRVDEVEGYTTPHGARVAGIADKLAEAFHIAVHDRLFLRRRLSCMISANL
jgi:hypothetical protein